MKLLNSLTQIILITFKAVYDVFSDSFGSGSGVISRDVRKILANPEDRKEYLNALHELKTKNVEDVEIKLSGNRKMKLTLKH